MQPTEWNRAKLDRALVVLWHRLAGAELPRNLRVSKANRIRLEADLAALEHLREFAEWAINHNWSLKSEFLYMQFEKDQTTYTSHIISDGTQFRLKNEDSAWVGRIGLNYRFGY